jgi:hypothetical protein
MRWASVITAWSSATVPRRSHDVAAVAGEIVAFPLPNCVQGQVLPADRLRPESTEQLSA